MVLNYIWIGFFLIAFAIAIFRLVFMGDTSVFPAIMDSTFASAKTAFEISLGLTGVLSLWMGIMQIGEKGGLVSALSRLLSPLFCRLFPDLPKGHPAYGHMFMNISANMLGLDNAATPLGLKAMESMQEHNRLQNELKAKKEGLTLEEVERMNSTASNPMIMFLVLNTSGLTLIPVSILVYRAQMGAAQPTDIFIPILIATTIATLRLRPATIKPVIMVNSTTLAMVVLHRFMVSLSICVPSHTTELTSRQMPNIVPRMARFSRFIFW